MGEYRDICTCLLDSKDLILQTQSLESSRLMHISLYSPISIYYQLRKEKFINEMRHTYHRKTMRAITNECPNSEYQWIS